MGLISKSIQNLDYMLINPEGDLFPNQMETAKEVIRRFDLDMPRANYVLIKGFPQSGKTGIFKSLGNIIAVYELGIHLKINQILFITGDNSKKLIEQQKQRCKECLYKNIIFMKRSELSKYNKHEFTSLNNTMIFIDESHFGTTKEKNILPQFLKHYGIDYLKNNKELADNNIYIISNSATPYLEMNSDIANLKPPVFFKPDQGYIGLLKFWQQNLITQVTKENVESKNRKKHYKDILQISYQHLCKIEKNTQKKKCMLFRLNNPKDLEYIKMIINGNNCKFYIHEFNTKQGGFLDYDSLWRDIVYFCSGNEIQDDEYLLVIIKDALRMGISIPNEKKNYIGVVYDVAGGSDPIPTITEQGLLGRMCGYRDKNDNEWKEIKFFSNESHIRTLIHKYTTEVEDNSYENVNHCNRLQYCSDKTRYVEYDELDTFGKHFEKNINNDIEKEKLIKQGLVYTILPSTNTQIYFYDAYDYLMSKIGTNELGIENFQLDKLFYKSNNDNNPNIDGKKKIPVTKIIHNFLKDIDDTYENYINLGSYRSIDIINKGGLTRTAIEYLSNNSQPLFISSTAYKTKINEDKVGRFCYQALMDLSKINDIENPSIPVTVKVSTLKYHLIENYTEYKYINKTAETMITE